MYFFFFQFWDIRDGMCKQIFFGYEFDINVIIVSFNFFINLLFIKLINVIFVSVFNFIELNLYVLNFYLKKIKNYLQEKKNLLFFVFCSIFLMGMFLRQDLMMLYVDCLIFVLIKRQECIFMIILFVELYQWFFLSLVVYCWVDMMILIVMFGMFLNKIELVR